jgi:hypothetical protein
MDQDILLFLLRAKKNTYAAHGAEAPSSRPNSHDLMYTEGDLQYIDTYIGGPQFAGEEAVWRCGMPVWSMNYCGRVVGEGFDIDFLKNALLRVPDDTPFRGPETYREGDQLYTAHAHGDCDWFQGYEEIRQNDRRVYECFYHGGGVR